MTMLFERLKSDNQPDWNDYVNHRFVRQLADGTLAETAFRYYLVQDYLFLIQFARAYALAAYKADGLEDIRQAAAGLSAIVDMEMGLHVEFCARWGIDRTEMEAAREAPQVLAYTRFVLERGMAGDLLDLHVALAPCILGYGEIGAALAAEPRVPPERNPYGAWIDMYASDDYQDAARAEAAALDRLMDRRGGEGRYPDLSATFATATRLEADFWQMGLDAA